MQHTLANTVRSLLHANQYSGTMCSEEFGTGLSWFSDFMSGKCRNPNPETLQAIYEKFTGLPLIPSSVAATVQPLESVKIGRGGHKKSMTGKFAMWPKPACPPPPTNEKAAKAE